MDQEKNKSNEELPKLLGRFQRNEGFELPKDYFATMQESVLNEVLERSPETNANISIWENLKIFFQHALQPQYALIGLAAVILIGLTIGIGTNEQPNQNAFEGLSQADFEYYIDANIDEMNSQDFYTALASYDVGAAIPISTINVPSDVADEYFEDLDDNAFLEFQSLEED